MELTKSELAHLLNLSEDKISLNNGLWDVNTDLTILNQELIQNGRIIIKFGVVNGHFDCSGANLISLEGCPHTVNGDFDCSYNKLTSLKYCPKIILGDFCCPYNELNTLEYCPEIVQGKFDCSGNKLTSLKYCPKKINDDFNC